MSGRHTVDNNSSPPPTWKPHGLIVKKELWWSYNAAKTRVGRDGNDKDPLEWESTNLWEDLYHHYLLRGYCNNSQIAPHNTSTRRCDIVTRYFDSKGRKTLLFTEVKRANRAEATTGVADAETQVLEYCKSYLKAEGSGPYVYACAAIGPFIRCFLAQYPPGTTSTPGSNGAQPALYDLCDILKSGRTTTSNPVDVAKSKIASYKDAGDDSDAIEIRACFARIKTLGSPPFAAASRPTSAGSAMSGVVGPETPQQHDSPRGTGESPQRGRRVVDPNARDSQSPRTPSQTHRQRSPPQPR